MENTKKLARVKIEHTEDEYGRVLEHKVDDMSEVFDYSVSGKCKRFVRTMNGDYEVLTRTIEKPDGGVVIESHETMTYTGDDNMTISVSTNTITES